MTRSILFALLLLGLFAACSDSFNDPHEGQEDIIDLDKPEILPLSLKADSIFRGIDTLDISVLYKDLLLEIIKFDLVPTNVSAPSMNLTYNVVDTSFLLDTFYVIPNVDTLDLSILTTCKDYAENTAIESFSIQVIP